MKYKIVPLTVVPHVYQYPSHRHYYTSYATNFFGRCMFGRLARMSVLDTEVDGSNPGSSMLFPWARHFIRIASVDSAVKWVPGGDNLVKDVQCYELFGGIALKNHAFSFSFFLLVFNIVGFKFFSVHERWWESINVCIFLDNISSSQRHWPHICFHKAAIFIHMTDWVSKNSHWLRKNVHNYIFAKTGRW